MIRRAAAGVVVLGVVVGLGCSGDGEPSAEAVVEAEELAESVLLTVGDLPGAGWVVSEWPPSASEGNEAVQLVPPEEATAAPWAEACGMAERSSEGAEIAEGLLATRGRNFMAFESARGGGVLGVLVSAVVFESSEDADRALDDRAASYAISGLSDERCREAVAAEVGIDSFDFKQEDLTDGLNDSVAFRHTASYTTGDDMESSVMETHLFVRGRVMGMYVILGGNESAREVDHAGLLAAFEARVGVAAHGGG